jgi:hypothetical protein
MINLDILENIVILLQNDWDNHCKEKKFLDYIKNSAKKERGHSLATYAQEQTANMLQLNYKIAMQTKDDEESDRSMGDFWIKPLNCNIYNPTNNKIHFVEDSCQVKSDKIKLKLEKDLLKAKTEKEKSKLTEIANIKLENAKIIKHTGQPNLVSGRKLLNAMIQNQIDSYYLIIESFVYYNNIGVSVSIYLADLLDLLIMDFVSFDAGPGQLMLNNSKFYEYMNSKHKIFPISSKTMNEKINYLYKLIESKTQILIENRTKTIEQFKTDISNYKENSILDQSKFNLRDYNE